MQKISGGPAVIRLVLTNRRNYEWQAEPVVAATWIPKQDELLKLVEQLGDGVQSQTVELRGTRGLKGVVIRGAAAADNASSFYVVLWPATPEASVHLTSAPTQSPEAMSPIPSGASKEFSAVARGTRDLQADNHGPAPARSEPVSRLSWFPSWGRKPELPEIVRSERSTGDPQDIEVLGRLLLLLLQSGGSGAAAALALANTAAARQAAAGMRTSGFNSAMQNAALAITKSLDKCDAVLVEACVRGAI